jgi:hypothetical protein
VLSPVLLLLLFLPASATSQQSPPARWLLTAGPGLASFSGAASRPDNAAPAEVRLAPGTRIAVALWRRMGGWEVGTGLALRLDPGSFAVENSVAAAVSASPLEDEELPEGYRRNAMRTIVVAAELRFAL